MKAFELSEMIDEFGVTIEVVTREGSAGWDSETGRPIEAPKETEELTAIVVPVSDEMLRFNEGGNFKASDRKVYTKEELDLTKIVIYKGREHTLTAWRDYDDLSDVFIYVISRRDNE